MQGWLLCLSHLEAVQLPELRLFRGPGAGRLLPLPEGPPRHSLFIHLAGYVLGTG